MSLIKWWLASAAVLAMLVAGALVAGHAGHHHTQVEAKPER